MLDNWIFIVGFGCLLGFLSGLGVGGGSLLILWLTLVVNMEHSLARSINLLFFIPCAIITSLFRWKQGNLDIIKVIPAIIGGCISAAFFSIISRKIDIEMLRNLFGILLLCTGVRELFYKAKKTEQ